MAQEMLAQALADAFGDDLPGGLVAECHCGQSAQVLIDQAKSARMPVLGSRGHGGFAGMLLGSVSSACVAHANCPVLVVHADDQPDEDSVPAGETDRPGANEPAGGV